MKIAIRSEEQARKVLCFVTTTYGSTKTLGNFRVNQESNREGGVEIPFELYAQSWMDVDLEFYDLETGERLGEYIPPAEIKDREETSSIKQMTDAIRQLVQLQLLENMSPELIGRAHLLGIDLPGSGAHAVPAEQPNPTPEPAPTPDPVVDVPSVDLSVVDSIMNGKTNWQRRVGLMGEQADIRVVREVQVRLKEKEKTKPLGATDRKIRDIVEMKLELLGEEEHQVPDDAPETETLVGVQNEDPVVENPTNLSERKAKQEAMIQELSIEKEPETAPPPPPASNLDERRKQQKTQKAGS